TGSFSIVGPSVTSTTLTGRFVDQVDHGHIAFNEAIDPNTFTTDQFALTAPDGTLVNVTGITATDTTNTQFDVTFDPQTALGAYTFVIGPNIADGFGNPMPAPYSGGFTISGERLVNGDFETGTFSGWTTDIQSATSVGTIQPPHSGRFAADLGAVGRDDRFWQD